MKKEKKTIIISTIVCTILILWMLLPVFYGEREASHNLDNKRCKGHLKKLETALMMYELDYNTYPESLSNLYPEYVKWEWKSKDGSSGVISLNIDVENKKENCFMCPAQTSFTRGADNVDNWTTYIYQKPPDNLKEDFIVLHCLGYPHFRQRCELWINKRGKFEIKISKYIAPSINNGLILKSTL